MIKKILGFDYKGFRLAYDEEGGTGWKCVIGDKEVKFKTLQDAKATISEILKDADEAIKRNEGIVIRKVPESEITKTVDIERIY